jgi:hypothetical protein
MLVASRSLAPGSPLRRLASVTGGRLSSRAMRSTLDAGKPTQDDPGACDELVSRVLVRVGSSGGLSPPGDPTLESWLPRFVSLSNPEKCIAH